MYTVNILITIKLSRLQLKLYFERYKYNYTFNVLLTLRSVQFVESFFIALMSCNHALMQSCNHVKFIFSVITRISIMHNIPQISILSTTINSLGYIATKQISMFNQQRKCLCFNCQEFI